MQWELCQLDRFTAAAQVILNIQVEVEQQVKSHSYVSKKIYGEFTLIFLLKLFFLHFSKPEPELFWLAYSVIRTRAIKTIASVNRICGPFLIKEWRIHAQTHFCFPTVCCGCAARKRHFHVLHSSEAHL